MANENLKYLLERSKKLDSMSKQGVRQESTTNRIVGGDISARVAMADAQINSLDNMVFGKHNAPEGVYDPNREMEKLKENYNSHQSPANLENTKLPRNIVESILSNPLDIDPSITEDPRMGSLMNRLKGSTSGVEAVKSIQKKMDETDRKEKENKLLETHSQQASFVGSIDYSLIKMIVETVFNEKMSDLKKEILSESKQNNTIGSPLKAMTFKNNKFMYLMENGDVYECTMTYKGKNRSKR